MPLVVTSVPNLAQGVSQQPDNLRYPGQCDEQINAWSTVVEGLVKRPNTRWVKQFSTDLVGGNLFTHFVKRDESNKYCVQISLIGFGAVDPTVSVINLESGNQIPVSISATAQSYLRGITNPLADLRALTVADYTFLVNKKKEVKVDKTKKSNDLEYEGLIVVKLGDYEKNYDIYLDGNLIRSASLDLSSPSYPSGVQSDQEARAGHTYESGDSQGSLKGEYADTGVIAEDLEIILKDHLASQEGLGTVTFSNPTGVLDLGFPDSGAKLITDEGIFIDQYEFKIDQYSTNILSQQDEDTLIATGVKGTMTFNNGVVQSWKITHEGLGYDTSLASDYYKLTIIHQRLLFIAFGEDIKTTTRIDASNAASYGYTMPDYSFSTKSLNFQVARRGAVIKITGDADFSLRTEDGLANEGLGVAYKEVQSITDLPKHCFDGFRIKVIGDADVAQDDYYVQFSTKDKEDFGEGSWIETAGWEKSNLSAGLALGIETNIDNTTAPITLVPRFNSSGDVTNFILQTPNELINYVEHDGVVYSLVKEHVSDSNNEPGSSVDADGDGIEDWKQYWVVSSDYTIVNKYWSSGTSYSFNTIGYLARGAGDNDTNPFPSFVGKTINDVFFFKNRLGFLTDSSVVFSEADEYFNFFRTTTQQLLDSAPIDVGLSHTKVAVLQHALPFQEKLMLFSDNSQFVLRGADILSPKTVAISPVTEYDISDGIAPLALGPYIYFPFNRGQYEGMYEYFVDNNTEVFEAEEITSQIPKYIRTSIKRMAGSASESMVLLQDNRDPKILYVYKYFWSGKEKIQSAWQKWEFANPINGFDFIDSTLYLILEGSRLVKMPVENALTDTGLDFTVLLDSRVEGQTCTVNYDNQANTTTISNLPDGLLGTPSEFTVFTKGGSERRIISGNAVTKEVVIEGFLASYVNHGGDYVIYNNEYYYCTKTHTSTSTFESNNWVKALNPPASVNPWQAATSYVQGTIYKCDISHEAATSPEPSSIPGAAFWKVSTDVTNAPIWTTGDGFYNNDKYFFIGRPYNMLYRFSNQALKQPTERGGRSASDYTYQTIRNASIEYADTGHFTVEVTPRFRDKYTYVYNPALLSSISTLDRFTPESGHFRFGVQCRPEEATIEVKSSSALPVKLLAAEFESMVTGRSKRYGA